jgi:hypothetical protein
MICKSPEQFLAQSPEGDRYEKARIDDPALAIAAGTQLCETVLEPIEFEGSHEPHYREFLNELHV